MKMHFVGIGGIGVSALAKYHLLVGSQISGSDLVGSEMAKALKKLGAKISIGKHRSKNLPADTNLLIYSPAVEKNNPELKKAKELGIRCQGYPEALGELTKKYFTIAICGTHGKSTTTAMIALTMVKAGLDPTVIVGTKLKEFGDSNFRMGKGKYLVIEADEHLASFLNYWPKIIVLTRLEADHLDFYKTLNNVLKTFRGFIGHLPEDGVLVANQDDRNIKKILKKKIKKTAKTAFAKPATTTRTTFFATAKKVVYYSLKQKEAKKLKKILKIPGEHNVSNALAVLMAARDLKIPDRISLKALSAYKGSWRRFEEEELKLGSRKLKIISDYGHHPTEVEVTLKAAREKYPKKTIWCVFQPHQYQRTFYLFNDFVRVLAKVPVDKLIITDIYSVAGRESKKIKKLVSSKKLVEAVKAANRKKEIFYLPTIKKVRQYLLKNLQGNEAVVIMGAGDIYNLTKLLEKL